jgi:hypothetical protein
MVEDSDLKQCQYFLVRYVPDVVKQEFINIGLFLFCPSEKFLDCMFSDDFRRITRFHAQADTQFLKELQLHFAQQIAEHEADLEGYIRELEQSYSNLIQLSPPQTCLATDLSAQLRDLFEQYVGVRLTGATEQAARRRIKQRMTESLRRYGVIDHKYFRKHVPASEWTAGDPFVFDFGYNPLEQAGRPNGRVELIHTLSLQKDEELAKALMWTFDKVLEKERSSHLTVGHEDILKPDNPVVRFSQDILQHESIHLVPVSGFDEYAQSIRAELLM